MRKLTLTLACLFWAGLAVAQPAPTCKEIPKSQWRTPNQLEAQLGREGWKLTSIKVINGCYQVVGRDPQKKPAQAYFNPKSFERVPTAG